MAYASQIVDGNGVWVPSGYVGPPEPEAYVLGRDGAAVGFDDATLGKHALFLGSIGSGKTVGMSALVASIRARQRPDDVLIFFDSKGDYVQAFHRPGDLTLSSGALDAFPGGVRWNLFAELAGLQAAELPERATELAASLVGGVGDDAGDNNRIWTSMAQDLLAALVVAYARSGKAYTNADLRAISDKLTVGQMRAIIGLHPDLRGTLQYIAKDDSNTTISVLIFLQQALRRVFSSGFRERGDFSVRQFVRRGQGRALFLEYDVALGATLAPVYATMLDVALKEALARDRPPGRVFFVLDEFALLPRLAHLDNGLNFGRSLGLRFVAGTQNVGQLRQAYGDGLSDSLLGGFGTVFAFRLFDQPSRDVVAHRFGRNRKVVRFDAAVKTRGIGEQLVEGNVIEDWELSGLGVGECIVGLPQGAPLRFVFAPPPARPEEGRR